MLFEATLAETFSGHYLAKQTRQRRSAGFRSDTTPGRLQGFVTVCALLFFLCVFLQPVQLFLFGYMVRKISYPSAK